MTDLSAADDAMLDAWLVGALEDEEQVALAQRLLEDAALRRAVSERQRLLARVRELPRDIQPQVDLWPAVAQRLESPAQRPELLAQRPEFPAQRPEFPAQRPEFSSVEALSTAEDTALSSSAGAKASEAPEVSAPASRSSRHQDRRPRAWARQLLAAALGGVVGSVLAFGAMTSDLVPSGAASSTSVASVAQKKEGAGSTSLAAAQDPSVYRPAHRGEDLSAALEADFLRARETLWVGLLSRRDQLPPETWEVVVENLSILDGVIRDVRKALGEDPGNRRLEKMLLANHQRQLDLLHRLSREV